MDRKLEHYHWLSRDVCCVLVRKPGRVSIFRELPEHWFVLVPIGAALGAYALIHIEGRYIAPYVVVLWMVLFRGSHPAQRDEKNFHCRFIRRLITAITLITGYRSSSDHALL
jgi:hypothetical protein